MKPEMNEERGIATEQREEARKIGRPSSPTRLILGDSPEPFFPGAPFLFHPDSVSVNQLSPQPSLKADQEDTDEIQDHDPPGPLTLRDDPPFAEEKIGEIENGQNESNSHMVCCDLAGLAIRWESEVVE